MLELLRAGVFLNPMGTKLYLSLAHEEKVLQQTMARFGEALKRLCP
jgi:glutamate-1-semialdehyde 2,1-aminomutase